MTVDQDPRSQIPTDHTGLRLLTFDECLRRLAECPVGRVARMEDQHADPPPSREAATQEKGNTRGDWNRL